MDVCMAAKGKKIMQTREFACQAIEEQLSVDAERNSRLHDNASVDPMTAGAAFANRKSVAR
jgi:hypothetical protein